jgi:hypothetical protein
MKKLMLMAYGICFVLAQSTVSAQKMSTPLQRERARNAIGPQVPNPQLKSKSYFDTLVINLEGSDRILLVGEGWWWKARYGKADSLKILFLNDFEKAVSENSITKEVQNIHYFVHGSGKRRLKAETPEYTDSKVDVDYEIKRLNLDIPQYHYVIYDLQYRYELHIYINDPERIRDILTAFNLNDVIHLKEIDEKTIRTCYKIEIDVEDGNYKIGKKTRSWQRRISGTLNLGTGILGNVVTPVMGGTLSLVSYDKYAIGKHKWELCGNHFPIVEMNSGKITGVSMIDSYDLRYMYNIYRYEHRELWWGVQAGFMKSNKQSSFNNAYKFGFAFAKSGIGNFSFDIITYKYSKGFLNSLIDNKDFTYGLTWTLPIL